jgi:hypothetical protein
VSVTYKLQDRLLLFNQYFDYILDLCSCVGQCKRAFHPREKDGRESNCETLGLTTAQLKVLSRL